MLISIYSLPLIIKLLLLKTAIKTEYKGGAGLKKSTALWQKFFRPTVAFPESQKLFPPMA